MPLPSQLTSCTPTKSNLYLDSSIETVIRKPALYKLLTFYIFDKFTDIVSKTNAVYTPFTAISVNLMHSKTIC
jgi:hypothetical protein